MTHFKLPFIPTEANHQATRRSIQTAHASRLGAPILGLLFLGVSAGGCSLSESAEPAAGTGYTATVELDDRGSGALTVATVWAVKGTYGSECLARSGSWAIALNGYALVAGETPLHVEGDDVGCLLYITEVKAGSATSPSSFLPADPFPLTTAYLEQGVAFLLDGAGATQFFANFRAEPDLAFASDFVVRMVYSDDVNKTNRNYVTSYDVSVSTATAGLIEAPNSTLSLDELDVRVTLEHVVKKSAGSATLTQGTMLGDSYAIDLGTLATSPDYASVDAVFNAASMTRVVLTGPTQPISAEGFELTGVDLTTPQTRCIIVARTLSGVSSYQIFQITFLRPDTEFDLTPPTVSSTSPVALATDVVVNGSISVIFSEAIKPSTVTTATFTLADEVGTVTATVAYSGVTATLTPTSSLSESTTYVATLTTEVTDLAGNALALQKTWSFTTETSAAGAGPAPINLATAGSFVLLAKSGITAGLDAVLIGDLGLAPLGSSGLIGLALTMDVGGQFATSSLVTGKVYASDYAEPTPTTLATALGHMQAAYDDGASRSNPDGVNLFGGELGGAVILPGLYYWSAAALITTDVTLNGGPDDVWIFQVTGALTVAASATVHLVGGAQAKNIYWVVSGALGMGASAHLEGVVLSGAAVTLGASASVVGRVLAGGASTVAAAASLTQPSP